MCVKVQILNLKVPFHSGFSHYPSYLQGSFMSLHFLDKTIVSEYIVLSFSVHRHDLHLLCPENICIFIVECRHKIAIMLFKAAT